MSSRRGFLVGRSALIAALAVGVAASAGRGAWADAEPRPPARIAKGPYLTGFSDSTVDVRFELGAPAAATLQVGPDGTDAGTRVTIDDRVASGLHTIHATGLSSSTAYAYVVRVGGKAIGGGRFTTAPPPRAGATARFLVYGDNRSDLVSHASVVRAMLASPSDFLVNTGDMVEDGGRAQDWQTFFDVEAPLLRDRPLFVAIGNHELYDDRAGANFARYFGSSDAPNAPPHPYGTDRVGDVRFFFLNAMHAWDSGGEERQWLEHELDRSDGEPGLVWRFAVLHHGPWSSGPHGGNAAFDAAHVPELLVRHKVDLLFSGHDHLYERGEQGGLKYVLSGGGGAPLYPIGQRVASARRDESAYHFVEVTAAPDGVRLVARRADGSVIERCGFARQAPSDWDCDGAAAGASAPAATSAPGAASAAGAASAPAASSAPVAVPAAAGGKCDCAAVGANARAGRGATRTSTGLALLALAAVAAAARLRGRRRSLSP